MIRASARTWRAGSEWTMRTRIYHDGAKWRADIGGTSFHCDSWAEALEALGPALVKPPPIKPDGRIVRQS